MRQVEFIMGMPISIDIPGCKQPAVFRAAFERFQEIDRRFSLYKKTSEASKFAGGQLKQEQLSPEMKRVIRQCERAEKMTNGYFSAWAGSGFDPSGYVKGWAISKAGEVIEKQGYKTYCIGAGGDILARSNSGKIWNIGIQDPTEPDKILNMLSISNGAVATSGNYQRGAHIINPKTKKPAAGFLSVTIAGPDIIMADIFATAVFAMGLKRSAFINKQKNYAALLVNSNGNIDMDQGMKTLLNRRNQGNNL